MRLASFTVGGRASWGVVEEHEAVALGDVLGARCPGVRAFLAAGPGERDSWRAAAADAPRHPFDAIGWLPPVPDPGKILCIGVNYVAHRSETGRQPVDHPTVFTRFADTQTGHDTALRRPAHSDTFDFEGELAVVIGRPAHRIARAAAFDHVGGYGCYMDGSVRGWQRHTSQFTPGKNFPATGGFGPWLVTADELAPDALPSLRLRTRVNGRTMQEAAVADMIFDIPALVEYCSAFTPLAPGDVLVTGTPGGVGERRDPPVWLRPGDTVEVEIDRVGLLRNTVADAA